MKSLKNQSEIEIKKSPIIRAVVILGTRKNVEKIGAIKPEMFFEVRREHFYPAHHRELKDVVILGLPQKYRFMVLNDMEVRERPEAGYFILFCSGEASWSKGPW